MHVMGSIYTLYQINSKYGLLVWGRNSITYSAVSSCVCVWKRERDENDDVTRVLVKYLPMVLSTSKPKPFSDFAALCISASFLPSID